MKFYGATTIYQTKEGKYLLLNAIVRSMLLVSFINSDAYYLRAEHAHWAYWLLNAVFALVYLPWMITGKGLEGREVVVEPVELKTLEEGLEELEAIKRSRKA